MTEIGNATHDDVRRYNLGRILRYVHLHGPTSRSELASIMRLNRSTVADLVASLTALDFVAEEPGAKGAVGRPSLVVSPHPHAATVIAYRLRVGEVTGVLMGLGGSELARLARHVDVSDPNDAVSAMRELAVDLLAEVDNAVVLVGVGVAVPGSIDIDGRTVGRAPNLGWERVELAALLREALTETLDWAPDVRIGNDVNLGALAERARGAAVGADYVVFLGGEEGIGAGIIVDGRLMPGSTGVAGEVGHMVVEPGGRQCSCGARGCWETVVGRDAILSSAGRPSGARAFDALVRDAQAGDAACAAALDAARGWAAVGIRAIVAVLNPQVLILSTHLAQLLPSLRPEPAGFGAEVRIQTPQLGRDSALIGAGELAFADLLGDPTGAGRSLTPSA